MRWIALLVLPWLLLSAVPALSADDEARRESRSLLRQGNQCLDKGDYVHAIEKFTQAYQRFPSPKILFSEGQALVGLDRHVEARRSLQRFLAEATDASPAHQAEARRLVAELEEKLGRVEVASNREGALVLVDQVEEGRTPLVAPVFAEPGPHTLTVHWQGEEKTLMIAVVAGASLSNHVSFDLKPAKVSVRSNRDGARVWVDGKGRRAHSLGRLAFDSAWRARLGPPVPERKALQSLGTGRGRGQGSHVGFPRGGGGRDAPPW